jgi:zinc/manganese transport system substrate-binding protein
MINFRRRLAFGLIGMVALLAPALAQPTPAEKIRVVTTFSILADFVRNVGGERVDVASLVGPNGDVHVFAPTPSDAQLLAQARLVVVNGLGLEGWIDRLIRASGTKAAIVEATRGITPRSAADPGRFEPDVPDPHAWQSVADAKVYVANIRDALLRADPAGRAVYEANAATYLAKLDALDRDVRDAIAKIPPDRRKTITTHDAFGYFGAAYGVAFVAPEGLSTDAEPSARAVATIINQVREQKIPAVFLENVTDPRLLSRIAKETGAKIGGTLYSDALTDAGGPAPSYIDLVRRNVQALLAALMS